MDKSDQDLNRGYVSIDQYNIIHWNHDCKRVKRKIMVLRYVCDLNLEQCGFCECVPVDKIKEIKRYYKINYFFPLIERIQNDTTITYKCSFYIDSENYLVSIKNIKSYGLEKYSEDYPNATIRMRDKDNKDYNVDLGYYNRATELGLRPFIVSVRNK